MRSERPRSARRTARKAVGADVVLKEGASGWEVFGLDNVITWVWIRIEGLGSADAPGPWLRRG